MTEYLKKSFSVRLGNKAYSSGWERIFNGQDSDAGEDGGQPPDSGGEPEAAGQHGDVDSGVSDLPDTVRGGGLPAPEREGGVSDLPAPEEARAEAETIEVFAACPRCGWGHVCEE